MQCLAHVEPCDVTDDNMANSTPGAEESRHGRKRLRYEDDWKRRKRKLQKDKGESYRTYKGEERAEKQLVDLTCKCAYRCREKVNKVERETLQGFLKLGSTDIQNKYLYGLIRRMSGDKCEQQNLDPTLLATMCVCGTAVTCRCAKPVYALCTQLGNTELKM